MTVQISKSKGREVKHELPTLIFSCPSDDFPTHQDYADSFILMGQILMGIDKI